MLILPPETPDTGLTRGLEEGNLDGLPVDPPLARLTLSRGEGQQRTVVNRLYEAVAEGVERGAQCPNVLANRYVLLCFRNDGSVVENGPPLNGGRTIVDRDYRIDEIAVVVAMADAQLGELARCAAHRVLMALCAGASIENGPQARCDIVLCLVDLLVSCEGVTRRLCDAVANAFGARMLNERRSVKAGRGFGWRRCSL